MISTLASMLLAAVILAAAPSTPGPTVPIVSHSDQGDAQTRAHLESLLGPGKRVRDFAAFATEKDEPATLVLVVTNITSDPGDNTTLEDDHTCPGQFAGIPLVGTYHVALVISDRLVNEITIPTPDWLPTGLVLPLRNFRWANSAFWCQGTPPTQDDPNGSKVEVTKLIKLADYDGDGHTWEFRLLQYGVCGHQMTLLSGYSTKQRKVIVYPIVRGSDLTFWNDNFFPRPDTPNAKTVHDIFRCGDHGNDVLRDDEFAYNADLEAWVMTREDTGICIGEYVGADRDARPVPTPANVRVTIGSARGRAGDTVTIGVTIDPNGADITAVQIGSIIPDVLWFEECTASGVTTRFHSIKVLATESRVLLAGLDDGRFRDPQPFKGVPNGTDLYTCKVHIGSDLGAGTYPLYANGLVVTRVGGTRLHAIATDGEIVVVASPTPAYDPAHH